MFLFWVRSGRVALQVKSKATGYGQGRLNNFGALGENFKWILFLTLKSKFVQIKINLLHSSIN